MIKRLIVNADDLGFTLGVTEGIVHAFKFGTVRSTTAMVCVPGSLDRIVARASAIRDQIGVHLQLTGGRPCLPPDRVPSLVSSGGEFPRELEPTRSISKDEVFEEWSAQVEALREVGIQPTHIDSHHNVHLRSDLMPVYASVAVRYDLPARSGPAEAARRLRESNVACPDITENLWTRSDHELEQLLVLLRDRFDEIGGAGTVELVSHPAYVDGHLRATSRYSDGRDKELEVLCSSLIEQSLLKMDITIIGYNDLRPGD